MYFQMYKYVIQYISNVNEKKEINNGEIMKKQDLLSYTYINWILINMFSIYRVK